MAGDLPQMLACKWERCLPQLQQMPFPIGESIDTRAAQFAKQHRSSMHGFAADDVGEGVSREEVASLQGSRQRGAEAPASFGSGQQSAAPLPVFDDR